VKLLAGILLLFACFALHAAPKQRDIEAYRALVQQDLRLATIGYRLASANAPFCARRERNPGLVIHDEQQYPSRDTARAAFLFRLPVAVSAVVPGGAADRAGIKAGFALVALNDVPFGWHSETRNRQNVARLETVQRALRHAMIVSATTQVTFATESGREIFTLNPELICASRFWVDARPAIDAGADGDGVRVTAGLMEFASDDQEMAAAVAHELAHNLLDHRQQIKGNQSTKAVLATEIEADRLSVWLMANAGYEPKAALRFIERYGRRTGLGIFSAGTHLRWKNRVKVMQSEIDLMERTAKQDRLLPPPLLLEIGGTAAR
jgi:beta-barrel assembly-enhancing protease